MAITALTHLSDSVSTAIQDWGNHFERKLFLYSLPIWIMYGLTTLAVVVLVATKL